MSPSSVIYSSDRSVVRAWSGPLTAAGTRVQVIDQLAQVGGGADLLVAQAGTAPADLYRALTTVKAEHPSLVVLQQPSLPATLDCLRLPSTRGVVVESYLDSRLLTYLAAKLLRGDIFGVAKVMPWGTRIHTELVNNHDERAQALATVTAFIRSLGLRAKYREAVELVLDELLMNALYNAPVGADGKQLFMEVAPTDRGSLRLERPVVLQYACDGMRFAAGVRDSFGSLQRETVLSYLIRCASSPDDQIERKTSGAGLGLWLVANNATEVVINLSPGNATEVVTVFDLRAPRQQLMHFGFYEEPSSRTGIEPAATSMGTKPLAKAATPSTRPSRMVQVVLLFALGLLVVAVALLIVPLMRGPGKGTLEVTVTPTGSAIYVNGVQRGTASPTLRIPELDSGRYTIQAKQSGYREVQELVSVATGQRQLVSLVLQKRLAKLRLTSTPAGAQVFLDGRATGLETPVELDDLDLGRSYTVRLQRLGSKPTTKEVKASDDVVRVHVELPAAEDFAQLNLDSNPPGARFLVNNLDTGLVTPVAGYHLRAGQTYKLKLSLPGRVLWEESVEPKPGEQVRRSATLGEGGTLTFAANVRGRLFLGDDFQAPLPLHQKPVPAGAHKARIRGDDPYVDAAFELPIKAAESVTRRMQFGFVQVKRKGLTIKVDKRRSVTRIAVLPGEHELKLHDAKTGQTRPERVEVTAGKTITLE